MRQRFWLVFFLLFGAVAEARIYIMVDQPLEKKFPIAVPDLINTGSRDPEEWAETLPEIIRKDLQIAGLFEVMNPDSFPRQDEKNFTAETVRFAAWNLIGTQALIKGAFSYKKDVISVEMRLFDPALGKQLVGHRYTAKLNEAGVVAHHFVDEVMEVLTGVRGPFSSRIAFASVVGKNKEIFVTDVDGGNLRQITASKTISISPSWDPSGTRLVYSGYVNGFPELHVIPASGGRPQKITNNKSVTLTPAWAPNGRGIAAATAMGDEIDLHLYNLQGGKIRLLTSAFGIDINPSWSPDGRQLVFASEREGRLHIFTADADGGDIHRLTFVGHHNDNPDWSPKGDKIVFQGRDEGVFDLFIMNTDGSMIQRLTSDSGNNESPSWAPNGHYIAFSSTRTGRSQIMVMMADGGNQVSILPKGNGIHPDWSNWIAK
ncbi:MAG: Tol-Pal system beta propeller repeat protein TolB [Deltaproteobacteria bacterium]|nr:Tol-Pal system beta propeller repeat protein TolB [Deltaproteobacteria bacterium]